MSAYYIVALRRCPCGKPITHEVQGSGNVTYFRGCKNCAENYLARLKKAV